MKKNTFSDLKIFIAIILTSFVFAEKIEAQIKTVEEPKFENPTQVNISPYYSNSSIPQRTNQTRQRTNYLMGATAQYIINQSYNSSQSPVYSHNMTAQQRQQANIRYIKQQMANDPAYSQPNGLQNRQPSQHQQILNILNETRLENNYQKNSLNYYSSSEFLNKTQSFENAFNNLNNMLTGTTELSVSKAYFEIEQAYGNTYLYRKEFEEQIKKSAEFIKNWLIENQIDYTKNENLYFGIQKFMKDTLSISIQKPERQNPSSIKHIPFKYDYNDFQAEKDHRNYFLTKCLATGTGQCNSLPATYLAIAEQLGAEAYLSFAPKHGFIKYPDSKGRIHSYEPTSNWKISDKWYVENMGIKHNAIKSGIYLSPLNKKEIVANCLLDLAFGYLKKFGSADGEFINQCIKTANEYYPNKNNITAYFLKSSLLARQLEYLLYTNGIKDIKNMYKVKGATELYQALQENEKLIKELGYQEMPEEIYLQLMQQHDYKRKQQENINTKQKRDLFLNSIY